MVSRWNVLQNKYDVGMISTYIVVILKGGTIESTPLRTVQAVTSSGNKTLEFDLTPFEVVQILTYVLRFCNCNH